MRTLALPALMVLGSLAARAQDYRFDILQDSRTPRPDGGFFFRCLKPALEGSTIIFRATSPLGVRDSIWATNLEDRLFIKLAGRNSPVPGGVGTFSDFEGTPPVLAAGTVLFAGSDSSVNKFKGGLYTVSSAGGTIRRVADYGTFTAFSTDQLGGIYLSAGRVVFQASDSLGNPGIYTASPDGSALIAIANAQHQFQTPDLTVALFYSPVIAGGVLAFRGSGSGNPATAYGALFTSGLDAPGSLTVLADVQTPLPGNNNPQYRTIVEHPRLEGATVAFTASDANSAFKGIFTAGLDGTGLRKIVASNDSLPGLGKLDPAASFNGFALHDGAIAFKAQDDSGQSALFVHSGGVIRKVIASGDKLNGQTIRFFDDLGPQALSAGRLVFWASLIVDAPGQSDEAMVLASPAPMSVAAVLNAASYAPGPVSPGEIVLIQGAGLGPGLTVWFDDYPAPLLCVSATACAAIVPHSAAGKTSVQMRIQYSDARSDPVMLSVSPASPGLFSADATGTGQGAILNADGSLNSADDPAPADSVVSLFGTGGGSTDPPGEDGILASAPAPLQLPVSVTIGGLPAELLYAGAAPGLVSGVFQVNARVPSGVASGNVPVVVTIGGAASQENLTMAVTPEPPTSGNRSEPQPLGSGARPPRFGNILFAPAAFPCYR